MEVEYGLKIIIMEMELHLVSVYQWLKNKECEKYSCELIRSLHVKNTKPTNINYLHTMTLLILYMNHRKEQDCFAALIAVDNWKDIEDSNTV